MDRIKKIEELKKFKQDQELNKARCEERQKALDEEWKEVEKKLQELSTTLETIKEDCNKKEIEFDSEIEQVMEVLK